MNSKIWQHETSMLYKHLSCLSFTDANGRPVNTDSGFALWKEWTYEIRDSKKICYLIGNGASASIASHMAADLAKNALIHTQVFSDLALITAMGNDIGYEWVYSEPLRSRGAPGDILVAISSSGESKNVLNAVEVAMSLGMCVVTLTAMSKSNSLRSSGSLNAYIPAEDYGHAETCHAAVLHYWMDMVSVTEKEFQTVQPIT